GLLVVCVHRTSTFQGQLFHCWFASAGSYAPTAQRLLAQALELRTSSPLLIPRLRFVTHMTGTPPRVGWPTSSRRRCRTRRRALAGFVRPTSRPRPRPTPDRHAAPPARRRTSREQKL